LVPPQLQEQHSEHSSSSARAKISSNMAASLLIGNLFLLDVPATGAGAAQRTLELFREGEDFVEHIDLLVWVMAP
jgi:hypothetical protein